MTQAITLTTHLGRRLREWRTDLGYRQEDVADIARRYGLSTWRRSTVAAVEGGSREISVQELVLLAMAFKVRLACWFDDPSDDAEGRIAVADGAAAPLRGLHALFSGDSPTGEEKQLRSRGLHLDQWDVPERDSLRRMDERLDAAFVRAREVWPAARRKDAMDALVAASRDAEMKAARTLGIDAFDLAVEAQRRWGRSLTAERDERVRKRVAADASEPALRASRGHVTRQLLAELKEYAQ